MSILRGTAAAACAAALTVAGCGGGEERQTEEAKKVGAAKPEGDVTWCIGKDTTGAFGTMVKSFNEQNPQAKVKLLELPESADEQRRQQIQRLRAESPECDVLGMDVIWTAEYAAQGWLLDMTDAVEKRKQEFIPSTLETARFEDKFWGMPFNTNAGFVYFRTDQVGEPQSWGRMYEQAAQEDGFVYQGARYEGLTVNYLELLYSAGGKVVSDDGKKSELDTQQAREALTFMVNGVKRGAVPKAVATFKEEEARRAFEAGNATYMRNWPYAFALGKKSNIADSFKVSTFPQFRGNEGAGVLGGFNLAISAFSKNPEGSLAFINFVVEPEQQVEMAAKASLPPTLTKVYDDPEVKKAMPFAAELREAVRQAEPRPVSPVYPQISEAIYTNVHAALQGDASPDAAVKKMSDEVEKALETF